MRLLLDTHVLIWAASAPERLSARARGAIVDADERCVSVVSAWEYEAKRAGHPGRTAKPFDQLMVGDFLPLDFAFAAFRHAASLPPIHADPFDRMLIAQAIEHDLTIITADKNIRRYPVATLW